MDVNGVKIWLNGVKIWLNGVKIWLNGVKIWLNGVIFSRSMNAKNRRSKTSRFIKHIANRQYKNRLKLNQRD